MKHEFISGNQSSVGKIKETLAGRTLPTRALNNGFVFLICKLHNFQTIKVLDAAEDNEAAVEVQTDVNEDTNKRTNQSLGGIKVSMFLTTVTVSLPTASMISRQKT